MRLQREQKVMLVQTLQPMLRDGRAQQITTKLLEAPAVSGWDGDIRVQVEAGDMRVTRAAR